MPANLITRLASYYLAWVMLVGTIIGISATDMSAMADAAPEVGELTRTASDVVVGELKNVGVSGTHANYQIRVLRTIKGLLSEGSSISVAIEDASGQGCDPGDAGDTAEGIWFLARGSNETYQFAANPKDQTCHPFANLFGVPSVDLQPPFRYSSRESSANKLAYEIGWSALESNGAGPGALVSAFPGVFNGSSLEVRSTIYKAFVSSARRLAALGWLGLVSIADSTALSELPEIPSRLAPLTSETSNVADSEGNSILLTVAAIRDSRTTDTRAIHFLDGLLRSAPPEQYVRIRAAEALEWMHSADAVIVMAPLLEDSDVEMRSLAVGTLACFANAVPPGGSSRKASAGIDLDEPGPYKTEAVTWHFVMGMASYQPREAYYLSFWKQWWSTNRKAVSAGSGPF